ncbi:MAG: hypothetical protein AUI08_07625 [Gemmatimonadetes bacterium 13_2_20CM_2_65_7]|nr:MAG: hypothetical protein AUI08_07625 [Gemmatimonadetes bacterium 13_2_20CM_2_65_7]
MNEDAMIAAAKRLGTGPTERLDVEATARKVMERLREQPADRFEWIHVQWVRIAAAVAIGSSDLDELVGGTGTTLPEGSSDLRELDEQQLRRVLHSLEG